MLGEQTQALRIPILRLRKGPFQAWGPFCRSHNVHDLSSPVPAHPRSKACKLCASSYQLPAALKRWPRPPSQRHQLSCSWLQNEEH